MGDQLLFPVKFDFLFLPLFVTSEHFESCEEKEEETEGERKEQREYITKPLKVAGHDCSQFRR